MRILSHRGLWRNPEEKNTLGALQAAFERGFGVETDIRDLAGEIVISHDPPKGGEATLASLLELHSRMGKNLPLALNVKSDGMAGRVKELLDRYEVRDCFFFDMSVPDMFDYLRKELAVHTRESEFETKPVCLDRAKGVWLDSFTKDWFGEEQISVHLAAGREVAIVSPELHGRSQSNLWGSMRIWGCVEDPRLSICTDFPEDAKRHFQ